MYDFAHFYFTFMNTFFFFAESYIGILVIDQSIDCENCLLVSPSTKATEYNF